MISMMWNAARSSTWKEIFDIDSEKNLEKYLKNGTQKNILLKELLGIQIKLN